MMKMKCLCHYQDTKSNVVLFSYPTRFTTALNVTMKVPAYIQGVAVVEMC